MLAKRHACRKSWYRCTDQHEHTLQDDEYNWHDSLQARLIERIVPIVPIKAISSPRRLQPEDTSSKHTLSLSEYQSNVPLLDTLWELKE